MRSNYKSLAAMLTIHFFVMLAVMYTMVDNFTDVFINLNQIYMTLMMVAPMPISMLLFMPSMYLDKSFNLILYLISAVGFVIFLFFMRAQTFVGNEQFLRSMIPHHSGAVLMCEKGKITDPKIIALCKQIVESQQREIGLMKEMLKRY